MDKSPKPYLFYPFLGSHSLLIGLLPFYLPVFLWGKGFSLADISLLIGLSGLSFCVALSAWQRFSQSRSLRSLMLISFALELLLVLSTFTTEYGSIAIVCIGIANGLYNGFFWTTQRTLFLQLLGNNDTGKRYGNFQIFVTVFLKVGILIGGYLLDIGGLPWLLMLSTVIGGLSSVWFYKQAGSAPLHKHKHEHEHEHEHNSIPFLSALRFKDQKGSRPAFITDGFFLFLESHFWTLSLFMLAKENYATLGIIVVVLAVCFAFIFFLIKNTIDTIAVQTVFKVAVLLYALSWLLRSVISDDFNVQLLTLSLILITFCSSFFRLAFNKRFFDIAQESTGVEYLIIKSYLTQFVLGIGFLVLGIIFTLSNATPSTMLTAIYLLAAVTSLIYLLYKK